MESDLGSLPRIDADALAHLLPMDRAVQVLDHTLRGDTSWLDASAPRTVAEVPAGQLLFMPAQLGRYAGVKLASVAPGNASRNLPRINAIYVLLDAETLIPVALMDGTALTSLRTPAVSAVAVDHLAAPEASRLVVFGTGPQALGHVEAVRAVRPITHVGVVGRHAGRRDAFLEQCARAGLEASAVGPDAVADADVIACCTTAREPLFAGELVPGHATVVAMGSHEPEAREVDSGLVRRSTLVVESRAAALNEAGDVIIPLGEGAFRTDHIAGDLAGLVSGKVAVEPGRPRLFKGVGMAWQDLAVASAAYEASRS
ncbi:ornithine cyclodeaminase family protein [Streptomyces monticola]|uniref:Ornithine cyclodeaminase family protein n=1 Tax=Streptomyces monticola TaxID=2666263 RepID=A0ABW2JDB4_9ACTN